MALFRRNKDVEAVPAEVRDYYKSERRERTGLAWLLALGTLVVTLLLAAGLFFGGRWAYRKIAQNDTKKGTTASQTQQGDNKQSGNGGTGTSSTSTSTPSDSSNDGNGTTTAQNTGGNASGSSSGAATPAGGSGGGASTATSPPSSLVNTGPGDESGLEP